jgi:hypothetical protein
MLVIASEFSVNVDTFLSSFNNFVFVVNDILYSFDNYFKGLLCKVLVFFLLHEVVKGDGILVLIGLIEVLEIHWGIFSIDNVVGVENLLGACDKLVHIEKALKFRGIDVCELGVHLD